MKIRRLFSLTLAAILLLCVIAPLPAYAQESVPGFSGTRTVIFTADASNVNHFLNGGRERLDLTLRYQAPQWLTYSLRCRDRDLILTLQFSFCSLDEYTARISQLLGRTPNILCTDFNGPVLTEDFSAIELTNFLSETLGIQESDTAWSFEKLFTATTNTLELNGQLHEFGPGPIQLTPQANGTIYLQSLDVTTKESDDGILERTLTVSAGSAGFDKAQWEALLKRFEDTGEADSHSSTSGQTASVTFQAADAHTLAQFTGYCLNTAVNFSQTVTEIRGYTMEVHRTELFLLAGLMAEDGRFTYNYQHPDSYEDLTALSDMTDVSGTSVTAEGQSCIQTAYRQKFGFSSVTVDTDYSNLFGKIHRTITLTAPTAQAAPFHAKLKELLVNRLVPGTDLDIYDQDGMRFYTLRFSAWFDSDINEFTHSILDGGNYSRSDSWLPYGECTLREQLPSCRLANGMAAARRIRLTYRFSGLSDVTIGGSGKNDGTAVIYDGPVASITYQQLHLGKLIPEILALVLILLAILIPIRKLRSRPRAQKPAQTAVPKSEAAEIQKPAQSVAPKIESIEIQKPAFCRKCGAKLLPGSGFCTSCGNPQDPPQ